MEYNKKELDEWAKKSIPILQTFGYLKNEINWVGVIVAFVIGMTLSGVLFYGIYNDKFKSNIFQDVQLNPNITSLTTNEYNFNPATNLDNKYSFNPNYSIFVNNFVSCP